MDLKELKIRGISHSQSKAGAYALILEEAVSRIKLPIVIGSYEAQGISIGMEKDINPTRPLTHDVFSKFITESGYKITSIIIHSIVDSVFYSNINLSDAEGNRKNIVLDARTSDAVSMAVRQNAPIYTTSEILDEAGIILEIYERNPQDSDDDFEDDLDTDSLEKLPSDTLKAKLEEAVEIEDFDTAAKIQEILNKRNRPID